MPGDSGSAVNYGHYRWCLIKQCARRSERYRWAAGLHQLALRRKTFNETLNPRVWV